MTADEPYWLSMGANFYYALGQREFENTVYEYQPAVTTMWIVTLGMLFYFPQYRGLGQGYLEFEKGVLDPFMLEHGKDPLVLLQISRLIQVLIIVFLLLLSFYLLRRLVGSGMAFTAIAFASLDPFFLGHSRLLDHEGMLAGFILISILAFSVYLFQERRLAFLVISAVAAGLAQLTKSSGVALLAPTGLLLIIYLVQKRSAWRSALLELLKFGLIWLVVLGFTYVLFWPGMWVAPSKMLNQVYGNAFSYAFRGARLIAVDQTEADSQSLDLGLSDSVGLLGMMRWHTTTITWIGILLAVISIFTPLRKYMPAGSGRLGMLWAVAAGAFLVMFSLAKGRDSPHYLLTAYLMFGLLAAMGWFVFLCWMFSRLEPSKALVGAVSLLLLFQLASAVNSFYPYYFTYENRLLAQLRPRSYPLFAYGEGLELAAEYLDSLPSSEDTVALVYYSRGCFSYFFSGRSDRFKPYYVDDGHQEELMDAMEKADYLVLYPAVQGKLEKYAAMLDALSAVEPVKEVRLNGYPYVLIYRIDAISPSLYEHFFNAP